MFQTSIEQARTNLIQLLSIVGPENVKIVFPSMVNLSLLSHTCEAWNTFRKQQQSISRTTSNNLIVDTHIFQQRISLFSNHFDLIEPVLALHGVLLRLTGNDDSLASHFTFVADVARQANRSSFGSSSIRSALCSAKLSSQNALALKLAEAQITWNNGQGMVEQAIRSVKQIVNAFKHQTEHANQQMVIQTQICTFIHIISTSVQFGLIKFLYLIFCVVTFTC
jgi:hypothetical protein